MRILAYLFAAISLLIFACANVLAADSDAQSNAKLQETQNTGVTEIIIVGTIHQAHNTSLHYSAADVKRILVALQPAASCVEMFTKNINPDGSIKEEILKGGYAPEIAAENEAAKSLGVPHIAFDREDRDEYWQKVNYWERQRKVNDSLNALMKKLYSSDPEDVDVKAFLLIMNVSKTQEILNKYAPAEVINSEEHDEIIRLKHITCDDLLQKIVSKYPEYYFPEDEQMLEEEWQTRNRIMAENIARIAATYHGKRLVVTTGAEHRYMLRELLSKKPGIVLKEFWEVLPQNPANNPPESSSPRGKE